MIGHATYEAWCPKAPGKESNSQRPLRHGPDLSVVKYVPRVYRNVEELQAVPELNASLPYGCIQNMEVSDSQIGSFDAVQIDADLPVSVFTSDSETSSQVPKILMVQKGKSVQAIGHANNVYITNSMQPKTLEEATKKLDACQKKLQLYEQLGIIDCTEKLKGSDLEPLTCMSNVFNSLYFMGVGGEKWVKTNHLRRVFANMLRETKARGGEVRFLLINPASQAYSDLYELRGESVPYESYSHFVSMTKKFDNLKVRLYDHLPSFRMQFVDKTYLAVSHYYFKKADHEEWEGGWKIPHLIIRNAGREYGKKQYESLFDAFLVAYDSFWKNGIDIIQWQEDGGKFNK